jgi:hypothetical protein
MAEEEPVYVVVGRRRSWARARAPTLAFLVVNAGAVASLVALWVLEIVNPEKILGAFMMGAPILGLIVASAVQSWLRRTEGQVAFYDDRIAFDLGRGGRLIYEITYREVVSFDDGASDRVLLDLWREDPDKYDDWDNKLSIPTLREEDRVAVLRLLDEKGVRRK